MCTYITETIGIAGSGKGADGWFRLTDATVYFDHPVHAMAEHTLNIDLTDPAGGPSARLAVELTCLREECASPLATDISIATVSTQRPASIRIRDMFGRFPLERPTNPPRSVP